MGAGNEVTTMATQRNSKYSDEFKAEVVEYSMTHSYDETKEVFNIGRDSVWVWRNAAGLTKPRARKVVICQKAKMDDALIALRSLI
ncbi:MAG: hypothetical protein ABUJ92_00700 [Desulfobacterales bacterium]